MVAKRQQNGDDVCPCRRRPFEFVDRKAARVRHVVVSVSGTGLHGGPPDRAPHAPYTMFALTGTRAGDASSETGVQCIDATCTPAVRMRSDGTLLVSSVGGACSHSNARMVPTRIG
jgi:hypothetical protein